MSSYRQILYHIIIRTKDSKRTLFKEGNERLFAYIIGIARNKNCFVYRINGTDDHIHILSDLHPSAALADYVRDIKTATSLWLKQQKEFNLFEAWSEGYAAVTCSYKDKGRLIEYIINQQDHHKKETFIDEYRRLLIEEGIEINEKFFP